MSRANGSNGESGWVGAANAAGVRPRRVAVLHAQGSAWKLVIVEGNGQSRVIDARTLSAGDALALSQALREHRADRLLRILPSSAVVCRIIDAPDGSDADTAAALHLIAEATLPAGLAPHRRAFGLLEARPAGRRVAMLLGWSGTIEPAEALGVECAWAPEPAALAALVGPRTGIAACADRSNGSIGIIRVSGDRVVARALREATSGEPWNALVEQRLMQTLGEREGSSSLVEFAAAGRTLLLDPATAAACFEGVEAVRRDPAWMADYAIALAAGLGLLRAGPVSRGLFNLFERAPKEHTSPLRRAMAWAGAPRRALAIAAAALLFTLLVPLASAGLRLALLDRKSGGLTEQRALEDQDRLRLAFADELDKRRWPMTKLLADISRALPQGVIAQSIRLEPGQRAVVRGRAPSLELVNQLQTRLSGSGVFADASIDRTQAAAQAGEPSGEVEFDLSARVVRPFNDAKGLDDFAAKTLAQRLYGEGAALVETTSDDLPSGSASRPRRASRPADQASDEPAADAPRERAARSSAPKPAEVPPPITDEEIAKLDAKAAMKEWTSRQAASKKSGIDAQTKERLKSEAEKCKARMQDARKAGGA